MIPILLQMKIFFGQLNQATFQIIGISIKNGPY